MVSRVGGSAPYSSRKGGDSARSRCAQSAAAESGSGCGCGCGSGTRDTRPAKRGRSAVPVHLTSVRAVPEAPRLRPPHLASSSPPGCHATTLTSCVWPCRGGACRYGQVLNDVMAHRCVIQRGQGQEHERFTKRGLQNPCVATPGCAETGHGRHGLGCGLAVAGCAAGQATAHHVWFMQARPCPCACCPGLKSGQHNGVTRPCVWAGVRCAACFLVPVDAVARPGHPPP